jgi:transcriptional antiterminator
MKETEEKQIRIITIQPYTTVELSRIYRVSRATIRRWLKKIAHLLGERDGNYWQIPQVKIIFKHLDLPSYVVIHEGL